MLAVGAEACIARNAHEVEQGMIIKQTCTHVKNEAYGCGCERSIIAQLQYRNTDRSPKSHAGGRGTLEK
jgi:hypothetical protein